jgi:glycerol-3-phosphate acyltransferase PlsY
LKISGWLPEKESHMVITVVVSLGLAYFLGSLPTALIVSRMLAHADIRQLGDGNMGARNTARTLGWKAGGIVAVIDISKGACSVWMAQTLGLEPFWQVMTAACAVLGHDFPVYAGFHGGQGLAATLGTFFVLVPWASVYGMAAYGVLYGLTRHFDLSAGVGIGLLVLQTWRSGQPTEIVVGEVAIILLVPFKKILDRHTHVSILDSSLLENSLPDVHVEEKNGLDKNTTRLHR